MIKALCRKDLDKAGVWCREEGTGGRDTRWRGEERGREVTTPPSSHLLSLSLLPPPRPSAVEDVTLPPLSTWPFLYDEVFSPSPRQRTSIEERQG